MFAKQTRKTSAMRGPGQNGGIQGARQRRFRLNVLFRLLAKFLPYSIRQETTLAPSTTWSPAVAVVVASGTRSSSSQPPGPPISSRQARARAAAAASKPPSLTAPVPPTLSPSPGRLRRPSRRARRRRPAPGARDIATRSHHRASTSTRISRSARTRARAGEGSRRRRDDHRVLTDSRDHRHRDASARVYSRASPGVVASNANARVSVFSPSSSPLDEALVLLADAIEVAPALGSRVAVFSPFMSRTSTGRRGHDLEVVEVAQRARRTRRDAFEDDNLRARSGPRSSSGRRVAS